MTAKPSTISSLNPREKFTPDFDEKHIRSIVEFLYKSKAEDNASKICNIYGSRGYEFLRDIYEKYPDKQ